MKLLNSIVSRRPLSPPALPPAEDFRPSDFATDTLDAFELASQECDAERLTVGSRLTRLSGSGPAWLKIIGIDGERITCNSSIGGPGANTVWSPSQLVEHYTLPLDDA